uniref:Uncharacterized protein n=1 Tax=Arundo donax TaxID=35708 RepID=A0A0A8YQK9_ARUDO
MKVHATNSRSRGDTQEYFDPVSMKGCMYKVSWPAYKVTRTQSGRGSSIYRCELVPKEGVVTVEMI